MELLSLSDKNVAKLSLDYKESRRKDTNRNQFRYRANVYGADGSTNGRFAWDVYFKEVKQTQPPQLLDTRVFITESSSNP